MSIPINRNTCLVRSLRGGATRSGAGGSLRLPALHRDAPRTPSASQRAHVLRPLPTSPSEGAKPGSLSAQANRGRRRSVPALCSVTSFSYIFPLLSSLLSLCFHQHGNPAGAHPRAVRREPPKGRRFDGCCSTLSAAAAKDACALYGPCSHRTGSAALAFRTPLPSCSPGPAGDAPARRERQALPPPPPGPGDGPDEGGDGQVAENRLFAGKKGP